MSIAAGTVVPCPITATTTAGVPITTYTSKSDFTSAGWSVEYWIGGVKQSSPTWGFVVVNATTGRYDVTVTAVSGQGELQIYPPNTALCNVQGYTLDVETNNIDAISAAIASQSGLPSSISQSPTQTGTLGIIVDGDSFVSPQLTIPSAAVSRVFGQTTLTGLTLEAAAKTGPTDTSHPITASVVDATNRIVTVGWDATTLPALAGGATQAQYTVDVQLVKTGSPTKILTVFQFTATIIWQADTRTT